MNCIMFFYSDSMTSKQLRASKFKFCSINPTFLLQNVHMQDWADCSRRLCLGLTFTLSSISTKLKVLGGEGRGKYWKSTSKFSRDSNISHWQFFMTLPIMIRIKVIFAWVRICSAVGMAQDSANGLMQMYSHSIQ